MSSAISAVHRPNTLSSPSANSSAPSAREGYRGLRASERGRIGGANVAEEEWIPIGDIQIGRVGDNPIIATEASIKKASAIEVLRKMFLPDCPNRGVCNDSDLQHFFGSHCMFMPCGDMCLVRQGLCFRKCAELLAFGQCPCGKTVVGC